MILLFAADEDECERVQVWRDGRLAGSVCRVDAAARGLTLIDLGEDWVPSVLAVHR